ncbi:ABC transporter permease [Candidatus Woesearchaeota archaeon]|nr:ABC transporter permease [Candidatus Woesearchaeota archaeon]
MIIKDIIMEQYKNFKIIFRNLSSVLLLIIGPLALIAIIGITFSGEGLNDINIGVISNDFSSFGPAFQNFSEFAVITEFSDTSECVKQMSLQYTHICLEFSDDFGQQTDEEFPSGTITFYFDNSRKSLSNKIVEHISDYFGVEAEKISIESAKTIFSNIENMVAYLYDKNEDINVLVNESQSIKSDLIERKQRLIEIREEFLPIYEEIKEVQSNINNVSERADSAYTDYKSRSDAMMSELKNLKEKIQIADREFFVYEIEGVYNITTDLDYLLINNITFQNLSFYDYTINQSNLIVFNESTNLTLASIDLKPSYATSLAVNSAVSSIEELEYALSNFTGTTEEFYGYIKQQQQQFDDAILLLDNVKEMLDKDIESSDEYIVKIDAAVERITLIQQEMNESLADLAKLDPDMAEKLVKPILQNYEPLLPGIENIKLAFPGMVAIIIIFISILFANIVSLAEFNSKAFYRNLLAPVPDFIFVSGLILTNLLVVLFQISVLLGVGQLKFGIDVVSNIWPIVIVVILLSSIFVLLGMILSVLIRDVQTSILTSTFLVLGFFLFSDNITPLEIMPPLAAVFAAKNPFVLASLAFRKVMIFGVELPFIYEELAYLGAYLAIALVILFVISTRNLKKAR